MGKWWSGENIKCVICGKEFYTPFCRKSIKCCSRKCGYIFRGQSNTGRTHFKKGMVPWNRGKIGYMGANKTSFRKGFNPWNKGMGMATEDQKLRWSDQYKEWRTNVFKRDNWKCVLCGAIGKIEADHIKSYALYPKLRLKVKNGRTLCRECHKKTDTYGRLSKKQWKEAMVL